MNFKGPLQPKLFYDSTNEFALTSIFLCVPQDSISQYKEMSGSAGQ